MVLVSGGEFQMGSDKFFPDERPVRMVKVASFYIDKYEVTNRDYKKFVDETGYITVAERPPNPDDYPGAKPEMLAPGALVFQKATAPVDLRNNFNWWAWVKGANWNHPYGPGSTIKDKEAHPVVHIAYEDAETYANWHRKELPTEAEWEYAARGGLHGKNFTWGDEDVQLSKPMANTWQGEFPWQNLLTDSYEGTSPVGSFAPNGYGLFDMAGNVWEWTSDWYLRSPHDQESETHKSRSINAFNPGVIFPECSYDQFHPQQKVPGKVIKGGSHLCAPNYCLRYRPAARQRQMMNTPMNHLGFRCIVRAD
ncbi:formylglycine-generating enzyme family protein [Flavihumibacter sp. R14]|nr:formylglycine-generating enzyme family protein [Flavihumibacter soli]